MALAPAAQVHPLPINCGLYSRCHHLVLAPALLLYVGRGKCLVACVGAFLLFNQRRTFLVGSLNRESPEHAMGIAGIALYLDAYRVFRRAAHLCLHAPIRRSPQPGRSTTGRNDYVGTRRRTLFTGRGLGGQSLVQAIAAADGCLNGGNRLMM